MMTVYSSDRKICVKYILTERTINQSNHVYSSIHLEGETQTDRVRFPFVYRWGAQVTDFFFPLLFYLFLQKNNSLPLLFCFLSLACSNFSSLACIDWLIYVLSSSLTSVEYQLKIRSHSFCISISSNEHRTTTSVFLCSFFAHFTVHDDNHLLLISRLVSHSC